MASNVKEFNARWSMFNWIFTIFIGWLVFVFIPYSIFDRIAKASPDNEMAIFFAVLICLIPVIFLLAIFFAPMKYGITDAEIIVKRLGPNVVIPIKSIKDIRRVDKRDVGVCLRTFGVGGFCGSYGLFYSSKLGGFRGYLTNKENLIFIKTSDNRNFLISPDKPDEFLYAAAKTFRM
jgi:hypothetical protein